MSAYNTVEWCTQTMWQHATADFPVPAPVKRAPAFIKLEGPVNLRTVDGVIGMFGYIDVCGTKIEILVNTEWQSFLPDAIIRAEKKEAAVDFSVVSSLEPRKEPASLVSLQTEDGTHIGCGARVNYHGKTILLTCAHVLSTARRALGGRLFICKQHSDGTMMRMEMPSTAYIVFGHADPTFDAVGICLDKSDIPSPIWSKLGVGTATVKKPLVERVTVTTYGYTHTRNTWQSSCGQAIVCDVPGTFIHNCSTEVGWSGAPLYSTSNQIVGLHRGAHVFGRSNAATILFPVFEKSESAVKSPGFAEIIDEEMDFREEVVSIDLVGRGRYRYTNSEFSRPRETLQQMEARLSSGGKVLWSDMADETLVSDLRDQFYESNDSLNCQRGSEILPTPSTPASEPQVPASSRSLPPPRRTPILVTQEDSPSTTLARPGLASCPAATPPPASLTPPSVAPTAKMPQQLVEQNPPQWECPPRPESPHPLVDQADQLWTAMTDIQYATENLGDIPQKLSQLEQQQAHLQLEISHKIAEMGMQLENKLLSKFGVQTECLSSKLDDLMSAFANAHRPQSPEPLRRQRSPSQNLTSTRGRKGGQQPSSLPSSSRQGTTTRYQPRPAL